VGFLSLLVGFLSLLGVATPQKMDAQNTGNYIN